MSETCQSKRCKSYSKDVSSKVYGIDIDGVSVNFIEAFSKFLKRYLSVEYDDSQITDYYWHKCVPQVSEHMFWSAFNEFGRRDGYKELPALPGAAEGIKYLLENAKDVWFITGRPHDAYEQTTHSLRSKFDVASDRLILSSGPDYKSNVVNRLGIDVFFDDAPHYAESIANNTNAKVYLMDSTYNKGVSDPKITRVRSWGEFIESEK